MPGWEQKPVVVLAIEVTWQESMVLEALRYEPWTVTTYWEQAIAEKVQGFGGVVLQHAPSLRLVAFGLPQTLEQLPQRAVQAALAVRHLVTEAHAGAEGGLYPAVRQVLHWGQLLVDVQAHNLSVLSHRGVRRWTKNPRQAHLQAPWPGSDRRTDATGFSCPLERFS